MLKRGKWSWSISIGPLFVFLFHSEGKKKLGPEKVAKITSSHSGIGSLRWSLDIEDWLWEIGRRSSKKVNR